MNKNMTADDEQNTNLTQMNMRVDSTWSYKSSFSVDLLCTSCGRKTRTDSNDCPILVNIGNMDSANSETTAGDTYFDSNITRLPDV